MLAVKSVDGCKTLEEAVQLLKNQPDMMPLAAGTDIVPAMRDGKVKNVKLLDIHQIEELKQVTLDGSGVLHIGAMATHETLSNHPLIIKYLPALAEACSKVGSPQIRARATIGGNVCHASPAADTAAVLAAAGACGVLVSDDLQRVVLLEQFWKAPQKTSIRSKELLKEITVIVPEHGFLGKYYKIGGRSALTIAVASAAVLYDGQTWRVAVGSLSPVVKRLPVIEMYLKTTECPDRKTIELLLSSCVHPITDIRASKEYRLKAAAGLIWQAWYEVEKN